MNRFKNIPTSFTPNVIVDVSPIVKFDIGDRITDDSHYVPNKEANKILAKQQAGQLLDAVMYDNPKDIKSGAVNVYARQKGRDLAELTQQARQLTGEIKDLSVNAEKAIRVEMSKVQAQAEVQPQPTAKD